MTVILSFPPLGYQPEQGEVITRMRRYCPTAFVTSEEMTLRYFMAQLEIVFESKLLVIVFLDM